MYVRQIPHHALLAGHFSTSYTVSTAQFALLGGLAEVVANGAAQTLADVARAALNTATAALQATGID